MKKPPPRLAEAIEHIRSSGNLMPMKDVTVPQLDRLWDYIDANGLAVMRPDGSRWDLTDRAAEYSR